MYKSKFKTRKEAFEYTAKTLPKAKSKDTVLKNFSNTITSLKEGSPTIIMPANEESVIYQTFNYREGEVPLNVIMIDGDTILI